MGDLCLNILLNRNGNSPETTARLRKNNNIAAAPIIADASKYRTRSGHLKARNTKNPQTARITRIRTTNLMSNFIIMARKCGLTSQAETPRTMTPKHQKPEAKNRSAQSGSSPAPLLGRGQSAFITIQGYKMKYCKNGTLRKIRVSLAEQLDGIKSSLGTKFLKGSVNITLKHFGAN